MKKLKKWTFYLERRIRRGKKNYDILRKNNKNILTEEKMKNRIKNINPLLNSRIINFSIKNEFRVAILKILIYIILINI